MMNLFIHLPILSINDKLELLNIIGSEVDRDEHISFNTSSALILPIKLSNYSHINYLLIIYSLLIIVYLFLIFNVKYLRHCINTQQEILLYHNFWLLVLV